MLGLPRYCWTLSSSTLVVGDAVEHRLDHHLGHEARQVGADAAVRPEPERDVAVG